MSLQAAPAGAAALPVTVMGGYLGAGKTTMVNHLLRTANGRRVAVLVNDFGDIGIDADLIEGQDGDILNLAGGCVCCSFGSDLMAALLRLRERSASLDHVLIETSGVAMPATVASTVGLVQGLRVNATVVLVDASAIRQQAGDRYVGETVLRQLEQADLLVLNKLDLVTNVEQQAVARWMEPRAARACLVEATQGQLPPELLLDGLPFAQAGIADGSAPDEERPLRVGRPADGVFRSLSFSFSEGVDVEGLGHALATQAHGIVRAKGLLRDQDNTAVQLQLSGGRCVASPWLGRAFTNGRLVCIGPAATWNESLLQELVRPFLTQHDNEPPAVPHGQQRPMR